MKKPRGDSIYVHVPDATREPILEALATMPDEAFSWLVLALPPKAMLHGGLAQVWPDGIGGFTDASRKSIEAARTAAQTWIDGREAAANRGVSQSDDDSKSEKPQADEKK